MDKLLFENFKIFAGEVEIELAPITVFTGKNSSGKSTVIKGLLLLSDFIKSDSQLVLDLRDKNSIKHRLNGWENVKNWFSDNQAVVLGYSQNGFNFKFSFSAQLGEAVALLDQFVMEAPEINDSLIIRRTSTVTLDLQVTQRFLNYFLNRRSGREKRGDFRSEISSLKNELQKIRDRKAKASQQELIGLIGEEEATVKQLSMFQEQNVKLADQNSHTGISYNPEINIEDDEAFPSYKLSDLIRSALRLYMSENTGKGEKFEADSRRQMELMTYKFADVFNRKSQFIVYHLSPGRIKQTRLYYLYDGNSEFHELINWYGQYSQRSGEEHRFLLHWMKELGIGEDMVVKIIEGEAATVKIKLINDPKIVDLADLGYGAGQALSILLAIYKVRSDMDILALEGKTIGRKAILMIEEAESNLHPLLQSSLAVMFFEAASRFKIQFVLESHSEYLIRKFQVLVASNSIIDRTTMNSDDVAIFYLNNIDNQASLTRITIDEDGSLTEKFGQGFFDEADNQSIELLRIQTKKERQ